MRHSRVQELLPAYALGALESRELDSVAEHIQSCSICLPLAEKHMEVSALLARTVPRAAPPADLRLRVLGAVSQLPSANPAFLSRPSQDESVEQRFFLLRPAFAFATVAGVGILLLAAIVALLAVSRNNLADLHQQNQQLASSVQTMEKNLQQEDQRLTSAVQAVQALGQSVQQGDQRTTSSIQALGQDLQQQDQRLTSSVQALGQGLQQQDQRLTSSVQALGQGLQQQDQRLTSSVQALGQSLQQQDQLLNSAVRADVDKVRQQQDRLAVTLQDQQTFAYLQALPGINRYVLNPPNPTSLNRGLVVANKAQVWGVVLLLEMSPLTSGKVYQIWLEKDGVVTSAGVIETIDAKTGYGQIYVHSFPKSLVNYTRVFVTQENAPAAVAPTGPPLLAAPLQ